MFERDGGTTRLGYSQATDGLLKSSLSVFETTLDAHGQPQSAMTIDGQPADIPFARQFLKDGSAEFWKAPIVLPHDLEAVTL